MIPLFFLTIAVFQERFSFLSVVLFFLCVCSCLWIFLYDFGSSESFFQPLKFCCIFPAMPSCNQEIEEVGPAPCVCPSVRLQLCVHLLTSHLLFASSHHCILMFITIQLSCLVKTTMTICFLWLFSVLCCIPAAKPFRVT